QGEKGDEQRLHQSIDQGIAQRTSNLLVDVGRVMYQSQRADPLVIQVKRQSVNVDRCVVHSKEFAVAGVAFGGMSCSGRAEPEEGSKAGGYGEGHAIGIVDGDTFQMLALAEAVHQTLQALVRQWPLKL